MADGDFLIIGSDLERVPGVSGSKAQLDYAALRASRLVYGAWCSATAGDAPGWVQDIAVDVASRFLSNPRGLTSWTRSIDDASRTERDDNAVTGGRGFYLTEEERAQLCPTVRRQVGSIRLAVPGFR